MQSLPRQNINISATTPLLAGEHKQFNDASKKDTKHSDNKQISSKKYSNLEPDLLKIFNKLKELQSLHLPQPFKLKEFPIQYELVEDIMRRLDMLSGKLDPSEDSKEPNIKNVLQLHDLIKECDIHIPPSLLMWLDLIEDYRDLKFPDINKYKGIINRFQFAIKLHHLRENCQPNTAQQKLIDLAAETKLPYSEIAKRALVVFVSGLGAGGAILGITTTLVAPTLLVLALSGGAGLLLGIAVTTYYYYRNFHDNDIAYHEKQIKYQQEVDDLLKQIATSSKACNEHLETLIKNENIEKLLTQCQSKSSSRSKISDHDHKILHTLQKFIQQQTTEHIRLPSLTPARVPSFFQLAPPQWSGIFNNQPIVFDELVAKDDNHDGFSSLDISPAETVEILLKQENNTAAREELIEEIIQAVKHAIVTHNYSQWQSDELKKSGGFLLPEHLIAHYHSTPNVQNSELRRFCQQPAVYRKYVNDLNMPNAKLGCKSAKLVAQYGNNPFNLYVWKKNEASLTSGQIVLEDSYSNPSLSNTRHILRTNSLKNFNLLAEKDHRQNLPLPAQRRSIITTPAAERKPYITPIEWLTITQPRPTPIKENQSPAPQQNEPWYKRFFSRKYWAPALVVLGGIGTLFGITITIATLMGIATLTFGLSALAGALLLSGGIAYIHRHVTKKIENKNEKLKTYKEEVIKPLREHVQKLQNIERHLSHLELRLNLAEEIKASTPQEASLNLQPHQQQLQFQEEDHSSTSSPAAHSTPTSHP